MNYKLLSVSLVCSIILFVAFTFAIFYSNVPLIGKIVLLLSWGIWCYALGMIFVFDKVKESGIK